MNFQDKVVVITGAGAGIGLATAKKYAQHGAKLVLNSIVPAEEQCARAEIAAAAPDAELEFVVGNVAEEADCARIIDTAVRRFGRVDILCNIAGIVHSGTLLTTSEDDFVRTMDVNVKGTFLMMKHAVEAMKETGGGVIDCFSKMKIDAARRMIRAGRLNFTQIASALEFGSVQYFSRRFKLLTGMSPSEYARSVKMLSDASLLSPDDSANNM